jgi:hypothetical protein
MLLLGSIRAAVWIGGWPFRNPSMADETLSGEEYQQ